MELWFLWVEDTPMFWEWGLLPSTWHLVSPVHTQRLHTCQPLLMPHLTLHFSQSHCTHGQKQGSGAKEPRHTIQVFPALWRLVSKWKGKDLHQKNSSDRGFYHLQLLNNKYRSTKVIRHCKPPLSWAGKLKERPIHSWEYLELITDRICSLFSNARLFHQFNLKKKMKPV